MRKLLKSSLLACFFVMLASGCESDLSNGDLDGMWQLRQIAYTDGRTDSCEYTYYIIQHRLIELAWRPEDKRPGQEMTYYIGRFAHIGDSLHVGDFRYYKNEAERVSPDELSRFGLRTDTTHFRVNTLNHSHMTLDAGYALLHFRKF